MKEYKKNITICIWSFLALTYLTVRFGFTRQLDATGNYASYIFEGALVLLFFVLTGKKLVTQFRLQKSALVGSLLSLIAGFGIFKLAIATHISIPFDLKGTETLLFLLVVAPILEESIFRFFLWKPLEHLSKRPTVTWLVTSLVFSYSHLHAIWFVPEQIHQFIIYQTIYALGLGLSCGFFVFRFNSLSSAIALHFAFNLGFYGGSLT